MARHTNKKSAKDDRPSGSNGGFLAGLADVIDKLSELAETGRTLSRSGEFTHLPGPSPAARSRR